MDIEKKEKNRPSPSQYENTKFDERYIKPPKTCYVQNATKYSYVDEINFIEKQKPMIYEPIKLVSNLFPFLIVVCTEGQNKEEDHRVENKG